MNMKDFGFYRGVNLGGWFSQCDYSKQRMDTFITEADLDVIAGWGLDHVRIPVDYNIFENDDGSVKEDGYLRVEKAVGWCRARGLKTVLDLHKTAGFSFDSGEKEEGFFFSEACQERFYRLWLNLAQRFYDPEQTAFELLNEVTDESFIGTWNRVSAECIRRLRAVAPRALILVGSYHNNSAAAVPALDPPADDRVVYNFHCYDPLPFTHQGAYWVSWLDRDARVAFADSGATSEFFEKQFAPALEAAAKQNTGLYCGEYGVINIASPEDTVRWYRSIHEVFEKYGIARSAWSYRQMDFGLSDPRMDGVRAELLPLL